MMKSCCQPLTCSTSKFEEAPVSEAEEANIIAASEKQVAFSRSCNKQT